MRRSFKKRLRSLTGAIIQKRRIFTLAAVLVVVGWVLKLLAEQLLGEWIADRIRPYIPSIWPTIKSLSQWAVAHLVETSVIVLATALLFVLLASYWETRPPRGITPDVAEPRNDLGPWLGVSLVNHTGGDLLDCWVDIIGWEGNKNLGRAVHWYRESIAINIPAEHGQSFYFVYRWNGTFRATIKDNGPNLPQGLTEVALRFHANTIEGGTISMPFWVDVHVKWDEAEERDEIEIMDIST